MRDIAVIYHWSLESLYALTLKELLVEHAGAVKRYNLMNGVKE